MNKTTSFTKLSKSLLLGASATFLYTVITDETANAMFRPLSKIQPIYQKILAASKTGSQDATSTLRNTLGSSSIGGQNQNSLTTRPLSNPLTPIETPQSQGNTNPSSNRSRHSYSGINNNSLTNTNQDKSSPTGGQIITSSSINKPGLGNFISNRLKNFEYSSTNNQNGSNNQPNNIATGQVANLKSTFETNNKTSGSNKNSNNNQHTSLKNQSLNLSQDKGKTSTLVAKFYDSTPETPQTPPQTPPKVSELRKNFEPETQSNKNSKQAALAKFLGGKVQQNKTNHHSSSLSGSSETGKTNTSASQSSDSTPTKGGEKVLQLAAQFSGTAPKTTESPGTSAPPKVSDLRKNFETSQNQSSTSSTQPTSVTSLAKPFGGTVQQNKQKQQATQNKNSVLNLRGNFESNKPKTQSSKKNSQGGENVTYLVAQFSGTAPKTPSTPEEPTPVPPKVSELKKNFEAPKNEPVPTPEQTPISVRNLAKTFEGTDKQQTPSPSQENVKTLAKTFGGIKGGNKSNSPKQLTYEEMIK